MFRENEELALDFAMTQASLDMSKYPETIESLNSMTKEEIITLLITFGVMYMNLKNKRDKN